MDTKEFADEIPPEAIPVKPETPPLEVKPKFEFVPAPENPVVIPPLEEPPPIGDAPPIEGAEEIHDQKTDSPEAEKTERRGRPRGSKTKQPEMFFSNSELAQMTTAISAGVCISLLGDDWKFENAEEQQRVSMLVEKYFATKTVVEIPPKYILLAAFAIYAAPRLGKPKTQERLAMYYFRCKNFIMGLFRKKK